MKEELLFTNRDLRKLMVPLIIEQVLTSLMGIVDTMMVSNIGSAPMAGVSLVDSVNKLVIFLFTAMATGGAIICAQYLGHRDREGADRAGRQVLLSTVLLSLLVTGLCLALRRTLLRLIFGTVEQAVMEAAETYFLITAFSYPFLAVFNSVSALYRSAGKTRLPMAVSICGNLVNIGGNAFLMFGLRLGVAGAAIATTASYALTAIAMLIALLRPEQPIRIGRLRDLRPEPKMILRVLSIGLPTGVENGMFQLGKLVVQSTVSTLGTAAIAANAIVIVLEFMTSMPSQAMGNGLMTVAGQCIGAGHRDQARYYIRKVTVWAAVTLLLINWGVYGLAGPICRLAGMDADAMAIALHTMLIISILKPVLWPLAFIPALGMRAAGDVRFGMLVSTVSMWVFRVSLTTLLCRVMGVGLIGIWCGYFADWGVRSVAFALRFRGERWHEHRVI